LTFFVIPSILEFGWGEVMNVSLTPELEGFVAEKVQSGRYTSASEVIREALRLLEERDQVRQKNLAEVRQKVNRGLAQLDKGQGIPAEQARARLRRARNQ
jgi:antitoxin ParD1/3/4